VLTLSLVDPISLQITTYNYTLDPLVYSNFSVGGLTTNQVADGWVVLASVNLNSTLLFHLEEGSTPILLDQTTMGVYESSVSVKSYGNKLISVLLAGNLSVFDTSLPVSSTNPMIYPTNFSQSTYGTLFYGIDSYFCFEDADKTSFTVFDANTSTFYPASASSKISLSTTCTPWKNSLFLAAQINSIFDTATHTWTTLFPFDASNSVLTPGWILNTSLDATSNNDLVLYFICANDSDCSGSPVQGLGACGSNHICVPRSCPASLPYR
jgi:hypothetical protein